MWRKGIYTFSGFFSMTEALAQREVVLQGIRVLEGNGILLKRISLLGGDESDEISLFFGSCDWTRFLFVEDSRLQRNVHFETVEVNVDG